ncbi:MAG: peptidylprolyl isomerase [Lewinellaceae bacterium]|nr:peptidylprolyl isomerase [Lewinellaceae bacterium]
MRILPFLLLCLIFACTPPDPNKDKPQAGKVNLDLNNKLVQKLYDFTDKRLTDSLVSYLENTDPTIRYLATIAFASNRDSSAVEALARRLKDPSEEVRISAAFALGQIGATTCETPLIEAFDGTDSLSKRQRFNAIVLEAIGKCGSKESLKNIATVTTYKNTDTLLLEGQCRALYQFGLRGMTEAAGTEKMIGYAFDDHTPEPARLMAANYLGRVKDLTFDSLQAFRIAVGFVRASNNADIRMALASALGKSITQPAFGMISKVITDEKDWRVTCNLIKSLAKFDYDTVRALVTPFLGNANLHISRTAAEFFVNNGQIKDADWYWRLTQDNPNLPMATQILLFRASNKYLSQRNTPVSKDFVNYRLKDMFQKAQNPYDRAACIAALGEFGWNYRWIHDKGYNDAHTAVKTAAAETLLSIMQKPDFYGFFGEGSGGVRREMYAYLRESMASGDAGLIATLAPGFSTKLLNYKSLRDTSRLKDLKNTLANLKMPRDVEAYMALDKAIAFLEDKPEPTAPKIAWNHPIDWNRLKLVGQQTEATIETSKGKFVLEFFSHIAPGSVANFLELASTGYYNSNAFHRVVSNFVVQGGCPRGDGYGALDYTIRSEIGLKWYDEAGYVGMASAGPDTEGTQFFITHCPTPHLDGRYTIFGKVKSGMDVVDKLMPGDQIEKVTVKYQ